MNLPLITEFLVLFFPLETRGTFTTYIVPLMHHIQALTLKLNLSALPATISTFMTLTITNEYSTLL